MTAVLGLVLYPQAQKKAQEEIDIMLGTDMTLPSLQDRERLPYVNAVITEALRYVNPTVGYVIRLFIPE